MKFKTLEQKDIHITEHGNQILITEAENTSSVTYSQDGDRILLSSESLRGMEFIFNTKPSVKEIHIEGSTNTYDRENFFQLQGIWNLPSHDQNSLETWDRGERPHPKRCDRKEGLFYQRFVPVIGKTISFRGVDPVQDLEIFHRWQNSPRVAFFWELAQSKEELQQYLMKVKADPHMIPTFVEMDGKPVGYFELYWTLEDRLGPYYDADPFDRGFHFLIGEIEALGYDNTNSIVRSVLHMLFLDDIRTRRVMAEPRHDNKKVLRYAETSGWKKLKEFDFPHKRAALLESKRERFFNGEHL